LVADDAGGLDPPDRLEAGPVRLGRQPVDPITEGMAADLDPAVVLLHRFQPGQAPARHLGIQPESHVLA